MEREGKKRTERNCSNTGNSCLVLREPRRTGLTLLNERDAVLSLGLYNFTLDIFFLISKISQKVTKERNSSDIAWENKERKNRNENEGPIILALQIRQKGILSL